jgi:hypothetical protein
MIARYGDSKVSSVLSQQENKDIASWHVHLFGNKSLKTLRNPPLIETKRQLGVPFTIFTLHTVCCYSTWALAMRLFSGNWLRQPERVHYEHVASGNYETTEPDDSSRPC